MLEGLNKRPMGHIAHLRKQFKSINTHDYIIMLIKRTGCVCETQMPPIMANSKDGQGHKDKNTSRKILSQEMLMCNMNALILLFRSNDKCQLKQEAHGPHRSPEEDF